MDTYGDRSLPPGVLLRRCPPSRRDTMLARLAPRSQRGHVLGAGNNRNGTSDCRLAVHGYVVGEVTLPIEFMASTQRQCEIAFDNFTARGLGMQRRSQVAKFGIGRGDGLGQHRVGGDVVGARHGGSVAPTVNPKSAIDAGFAMALARQSRVRA